MNILAHSYLSFGDSDLMIGNFIADQVKGSDLSKFPEGIQKGILLHRAIDDFTDSHPLYKQSCRRIFSHQGHYARVVIDIVYDHFLAKNWKQYSSSDLETYSHTFYDLLESNKELLPKTSQYAFHHMAKNNWLVMYQSLSGIDRIFKGMHSRANYGSSMDTASELIELYTDEFQNEFSHFFEEITIFSKSKINEL